MSNLKDKAEAIKAEGEQERGEYVPSGVPLRMYNYWKDNLGYVKRELLNRRKENFCHFWRVVFIWAPLRWIANGLEAVFTNPIVWAIIGVLGVIGLVFGSLTVNGFFLGLLLGFGVVALLAGVVYVGVLLEENWPKRWEPATKKVALVLLGLVVASVFAAIAATAPYIWLPIYAGVAIVGTVLYKWGPGWMDALEARSDRKREERRDVFAAWVAKHGYPTKVAKQPGIVKRFLSGVWDFLVLGAQVIRVKKWKICPYVETGSEEYNEDYA